MVCFCETNAPLITFYLGPAYLPANMSVLHILWYMLKLVKIAHTTSQQE